MTTRARGETVVVGAVFVLYAVFAVKLLLFSRHPGEQRSFNVVPFATIWDYMFGDASGARTFAFGNLAGNVLLFVPLGADLSVLTRASVAGRMLVVASASLAVETVQGLFALGSADVDDVILNCLGGLLGILMVRLLETIVPSRAGVRTTAAVLSIAAVPVLTFFLFVIRLRM